MVAMTNCREDLWDWRLPVICNSLGMHKRVFKAGAAWQSTCLIQYSWRCTVFIQRNSAVKSLTECGDAVHTTRTQTAHLIETNSETRILQNEHNKNKTLVEFENSFFSKPHDKDYQKVQNDLIMNLIQDPSPTKTVFSSDDTNWTRRGRYTVSFERKGEARRKNTAIDFKPLLIQQEHRAFRAISSRLGVAAQPSTTFFTLEGKNKIKCNKTRFLSGRCCSLNHVRKIATAHLSENHLNCTVQPASKLWHTVQVFCRTRGIFQTQTSLIYHWYRWTTLKHTCTQMQCSLFQGIKKKRSWYHKCQTSSAGLFRMKWNDEWVWYTCMHVL